MNGEGFVHRTIEAHYPACNDRDCERPHLHLHPIGGGEAGFFHFGRSIETSFPEIVMFHP